MKKIIGLLIVLIGIALPIYAQPEDATVETIDGKTSNYEFKGFIFEKST